jgi:hypothetical protein
LNLDRLGTGGNAGRTGSQGFQTGSHRFGKPWRLGVIGISQCHHGLYDAKPRPFLWLPPSSRSRRTYTPPHQAVHLPSLVVAVPPPECVTTAWRPGRRRPPEFLFSASIEYTRHQSRPMLPRASPHQAAAPWPVFNITIPFLSSAARFIFFSGR